MDNIMAITYWSYQDALIQRYTLPYVKIIAKISGKKVYVVCLEQSHIATSKTERKLINEELARLNIEIIFFDYHRFGLMQSIRMALNLLKLVAIVFSKKIDTLHAWCTPGGAIACILSVLTGAKLVLDSFEPHAELMAETGTWSKSGIAFKLLFYLEKMQVRRASEVIGVVAKMLDYSSEKYNYQISESTFEVKPACVDFTQFYPRPKNQELLNHLGLNEKIVGLYAGKIGGIYLEDELFAFIKQCYVHWGDRFRMLMLTGITDLALQSFMDKFAIPTHI